MTSRAGAADSHLYDRPFHARHPIGPVLKRSKEGDNAPAGRYCELRHFKARLNWYPTLFERTH